MSLMATINNLFTFLNFVLYFVDIHFSAPWTGGNFYRPAICPRLPALIIQLFFSILAHTFGCHRFGYSNILCNCVEFRGSCKTRLSAIGPCN